MSSVPLLKRRIVTESETTGFSDEEKRIVLLPAGIEFIEINDVVGAIKEYERFLDTTWHIGRHPAYVQAFKDLKKRFVEVFGND